MPPIGRAAARGRRRVGEDAIENRGRRRPRRRPPGRFAARRRPWRRRRRSRRRCRGATRRCPRRRRRRRRCRAPRRPRSRAPSAPRRRASTDTLRPLNRSPQFLSPRHVPGATSTREPSAAASIAACGVACTAHAVQPSGRTSTPSTNADTTTGPGGIFQHVAAAAGCGGHLEKDGLGRRREGERDARRAEGRGDEGGGRGAFSGGPTAKRTPPSRPCASEVDDAAAAVAEADGPRLQTLWGLRRTQLSSDSIRPLIPEMSGKRGRAKKYNA